MAYDITKLGSDIEAILHGPNLDQITNLYGLYNRAARQLLLDVDPMETKRIAPIANTVFNQVYSYPVPVDLKGNKIINVYPQVNQNYQNNYAQTYNKNFNLGLQYSNVPSFTILFNSSIKTININAPFITQGNVTVNDASYFNTDGLWTVGGDATDLTTNNVNYVAGSGALQFNLTGATGLGNLVNTTNPNVNLAFQENQSTLFLWTYLPTASQFNSVTLQWGSDSSNYWEVTTTVTQQNTAFVNGWNLLAFQWLGSTVVGAPNATDIAYLNVIWNYQTGTYQTGVLLDSIVCRMGTILNMEYYSKYLFRNPITGAFQETVQTDSDLINLDTDTYNLYVWLCAMYAVQQQAGSEGGADLQFLQANYNESLMKYKLMYKSEVQKPTELYYRKPNSNRYRGWSSRQP